MATYYVDPAATGDNDGGGDGADPSDPTQSANWTNAWTDMQDAVDAVATGDTVYCRGTQTLATAIVFNATPKASFLGCDASGTVGAGQFVLDGANTATNCLIASTAISAKQMRFENITFKRATADGMTGSHAYLAYSVWKQCIFESNGGNGCGYSHIDSALFTQCIFRNNTGKGFGRTVDNLFVACRFEGNTSHGSHHTVAGYSLYYGCLFDGNGDCGIQASAATAYLAHCIFDANSTDGAYVNTSYTVGCRFTNQDGAGDYGYRSHPTTQYESRLSHNYFAENTNDITAGCTLDGTNVFAGADDGYVNQAAGDFNLDTDATFRSTAVELDWEP